MGSEVAEYAATMEAMRTAFRSNIYHNPMANSQILPALYKKSYLSVKSKECLNEDGMCSRISVLFGVCDFRLSCIVTVLFTLLQTLWCWSQLILWWFYQARPK